MHVTNVPVTRGEWCSEGVKNENHLARYFTITHRCFTAEWCSEGAVVGAVKEAIGSGVSAPVRAVLARTPTTPVGEAPGRLVKHFVRIRLWSPWPRKYPYRPLEKSLRVQPSGPAPGRLELVVPPRAIPGSAAPVAAPCFTPRCHHLVRLEVRAAGNA